MWERESKRAKEIKKERERERERKKEREKERKRGATSDLSTLLYICTFS